MMQPLKIAGQGMMQPLKIATIDESETTSTCSSLFRASSTKKVWEQMRDICTSSSY
jgi:hypothetical protein